MTDRVLRMRDTLSASERKQMAFRMHDGDMSDKIDIKVFILFLLDELCYPLSETVISEIVSEHGTVGRFDFAECFSELVEKGHVMELKEEDETLYVISALGHVVASELQGTLHDAIRERSRAFALKRLSLHMRGAQLTTETEKTEDGRFAVRCEIHDKNGILMDTTVTVPTESEAAAIVAHFKDKPEEVTRGILSVLTGKIAYYMGG